MKKYLNTPEEVIKVLKEGKEVKDNNGWTYKSVDGFIVKRSKEFPLLWLLNPVVTQEDKIYIEEAEPLKFEVGKFYKNRTGEKVLCVYVGEKPVFPVLFIIVGKENSYRTKIDGGFTASGIESYLDIIGEWED